MLLLVKFLNKTVSKHTEKLIKLNGFTNFSREIDITQIIIFLVIFESYSNCFFFINRKNIVVVYCFGTEFVKFTVREIKD